MFETNVAACTLIECPISQVPVDQASIATMFETRVPATSIATMFETRVPACWAGSSEENPKTQLEGVELVPQEEVPEEAEEEKVLPKCPNHQPSVFERGVVSDADMEKLLEVYKIELPAKKNRNWPPTICMVPMELRRGDGNRCYDPVAVQIGLRRPAQTEVSQGSEIMMELRKLVNTAELRKGLPQELQDLEQYKSSCVVQLISRRPDRRELAEYEMRALFSDLLGNFEYICACHSNLGSRTESEIMGTVRTLVTDGCFILHRLLKYAQLADREAAKKKKTQGGEEDYVDGWIQTGARCFALAWQVMTRESKTLVKQQGENSSEVEDDKAAAAGGKQGGNDDYDNDDWTQTGGRCFVWQLVTRDLLLLENQIPFLVILLLFQRLKRGNEDSETLVKGGLMLFRALCPQMLPQSVPVSDIAKKLHVNENGVHHLLHLFYLMVVGEGATVKNEKTKPHGGLSSDDDVLPSEPPQWIPGAKELLEAGIRLKKRKNATTFLDIKFDIRCGVLEIPPLQLYDHSEALFRNMIAFEQTYPRTRCDISTYSVLMSCLVSTAEDARILHLRGILVNMMNGGDPDGGRRFFDSICSQIHFPSDNYLVHTMADVNEYMRSRHHRWRAALVRDYFSNPWVAISVVAAVFLLGLTVLQTFFTVYPYYKPSK